MATWDTFATESPDLAAAGRAMLERSGTGEALLATVRGEGLPRINPINLAIVDGRLVAYLIVGSAKVADLDADGRFALHAHVDPVAPSEFLVRGRANPVIDIAARDHAAASWSFEVDDRYQLFEFDIDHVVLGSRPDADAWPPVYRSWRPTPG